MKGMFQGINYTQGSGIATVILLDEAGDISHVHADAGPLIRAISASGLQEGDEIEYATTELGTMAGFALVGDGA